MLPIRDSHPTGKFPFWVFLIIATNVYVFFLEITNLNPESFVSQYALIPALIDFQNYSSLTPLLTSQFLHAGLLHIFSNMLFLWIFGDNVEVRFGFLFFPVFYLLGGVVAALTQYVFMTDASIPMLGASGAVAAVLGAYFAIFPHHSIKTLIPVFGFPAIVNIPASVMLFYWFFTQLFAGAASLAVQTASTGGVAFFAHAGGFVFGWLAGNLAGKDVSS